LAAAAVVGQTNRVAKMQRRKRGTFDGGRFMWPGRIAGQTRFLCKAGEPAFLLPCAAMRRGRWLECNRRARFLYSLFQ
jgi:hypothetical protein